MIDSLILTYNDWANTGWRFFKCLQRLGLKVMMFKGHPHPFCYPEQAVIHPSITNAKGRSPVFYVPELYDFVKHSKVIHYTSSTAIDSGYDLHKKKVIMQHSGYGYRAEAEAMNKAFNPFVDATIIQMPDLLGLGAVNEHLIYFPVDTNFIRPVYERHSDKIIIGHFPSMPKHKGTIEICALLSRLSEDSELNGKFEYRGVSPDEGEKGISLWYNNLNRIAMCDVIIDVFNKETAGKPYGEWGNTSFEAAAMGKIVITNSLRIDTYHKEYGDCALNIANDIETLEATLRRAILMKEDERQKERAKTRDWIVKNHSIPATAERLWERVYKYLL